MKKCGIYKITSPSGRVYIGQSNNIERRWWYYKGGYSTTQPLLNKSFNKYGINKHKFEVVEICDEDKLNILERKWQDYYDVLNGGLNCILTETNEKPKVMSEETKKKISEANKGDKNYMYGRKAWNNGLKHSEETRRKMSESQTGDKNKMFGRTSWNSGIKTNKPAHNSKIVLCLENGIFYTSITETSEIYGYERKALSKLLNSNNNQTNLILV